MPEEERTAVIVALTAILSALQTAAPSNVRDFDDIAKAIETLEK